MFRCHSRGLLLLIYLDKLGYEKLLRHSFILDNQDQLEKNHTSLDIEHIVAIIFKDSIDWLIDTIFNVNVP